MSIIYDLFPSIITVRKREYFSTEVILINIENYKYSVHTPCYYQARQLHLSELLII